MSSNAQINANQRNAQHSTGPLTPEGKAVVARNATSHGLAGAHLVLPGEDPAAFDSLLESLRTEHIPASPTEDFLIQQMAQSQWKLLRVAAIEQQILFAAMGDDSIVDRPASRLANIFLEGASAAQALDRLARYEAAARRVWFQSLRQIADLRRSSSVRKTRDITNLHRQQAIEIDHAIDDFCRPPAPNYRTKPISQPPTINLAQSPTAFGPLAHPAQAPGPVQEQVA